MLSLFVAGSSAANNGLDLESFLGFSPKTSSIPKSSGYYNLTGSRILIDDSDPLYNWSKTVAENPWCSGNGTKDDPYIIENVYIDGGFSLTETPGKQHSANCLSIYRTAAYYIVRDCYFTSPGVDEFNSGIYLAYAENGIIYNNTLVYCTTNVFVNDYSHNTTVFYNTILNNKTIHGFNAGIKVDFSEDCLVSKNLLLNPDVGIQMWRSRNIEIRQNFMNYTIIEGENYSGVSFHYVNDSSIIFNVFAGSFASTAFRIAQTASSGNIITNNTVVGTLPDLGVPSLPQPSSDYDNIIALAESFSNFIAHNVAYIPGAGSGLIPGYDVSYIIATIGLVSVITILIYHRKK